MRVSHISIPISADHCPGKTDIYGAVPCRAPIRHYDKIISDC